MQTLADFKRLPVGTILELVQADGMPTHKNLNIKRKIELKQTNAIRFVGGSWLYYPTAKEFSIKHGLIVVTTAKGKKEEFSLYYMIHSN